MRFQLHSWYCVSGHKNLAEDKICWECGRPYREKNAQVSESERAVVFYNRATGEHRTPARADQPLPEVYARQGFERKEITDIVAWEKQAGVVHEATTFNAGNELPPEECFKKPEPSRQVREDLARMWGEANSSGPWTLGGVPLETVLNSTPEV